MAAPDELLAQLRDIHLPLAEVMVGTSPWPWFVLLLALLLLLWLGTWLWRVWQRRPQNVALRTLDELARRHITDGDAVALSSGIAALLRQQALRCFPAEQVASLVGEDWLTFLDQHGGNGQFRHGSGALLVTLPYQRQAAVADVRSLIPLARHWLRANPL